MPLMSFGAPAPRGKKPVARRASKPSVPPQNSKAAAVSAAVQKQRAKPVVHPLGIQHIMGNVYVIPDRQVVKKQADFSYSLGPWPVPVTAVTAPSAIPQQSPFQSAEDPGNKSAGEVMQDAIRGRMFESSNGLLVEEYPSEYGEENSFWTQGSPLDPMANWMDNNDRSSASTVSGQSLSEFGSDQGMGAFAMDGLASYEGFGDYAAYNSGGGLSVLASDIVKACSNVTNSWTHPEKLKTSSVASEMQNMGYPSNEIYGLLNTALGLAKIIDPKIGRYLDKTTPPPPPPTGGGQRTTTPQSSPTKIPVWVYPIVAIGGFIVLMKLKNRGK